MSWAAQAGSRAIDAAAASPAATPLAATKRAAGGAHGFFLDCTSPTAGASGGPQSPSPRVGGAVGSAQASARRSSSGAPSPRPSPSKPSAAALTAQTQGQQSGAQFVGTASTTNIASPPAKTLRPSAAAIAADRPKSPRPNAPPTSASAASVASAAATTGSGAAGGPAASGGSSSSGGMPLHAQQALRDEVALLKYEAGRREAKLAEKDAAIAKLSAALHDMEAVKISEHARSRAQLAALRKQVVESDARLEFLRDDLTRQKERECQAVARHNVQIAEEQNALLEHVTDTIRASATAQVSPAALAAAASAGLGGATGLGSSASAAGVGVGTAMLAASSTANSAASFHGAGTGLTHEEHLKGVLHSFAEERRRWDTSRARELASVREEAALRLEESNARVKAIKAQYASAYSKWKAQHAAQCAEIEALAAYVAKLAYLLEEIDRGAYPVGEKHGVRAFVIPAHKRKFLALDPHLASQGQGQGQTDLWQGCSAALARRMEELRAALARAGIPWDPRDLARDQSFLRDERQLQLREMQQQQLRIKASEEGEEEEEEQEENESNFEPVAAGRLRSGRREESKEQQTGSDGEEDDGDDGAGDADVDAQAQAQSHAQLLEEALLDSLASHPTATYIAGVEAERDRYKHLLARETRRKIEMHETLTSQARLIDAGVLRQQRAPVGAPSSAVAAAAAAAANAAAKESARQLNHSSSANKARDILAASNNAALHQQQQSSRIGAYNSSGTSPSHARSRSSGGELGGGGNGALHTLLSPSRPSNPYSAFSGVYSPAHRGARPASAAVLSSGAHGHGHVQQQRAHHQHSHSSVSGYNFSSDSLESTRPASAASTVPGYSGRGGGGGSGGGAAPSRPGSATWMSHRQSQGSPEPSAASASRPSSAIPQAGASAGAVVLSPAHYPKPTPLHITHGNASATLYAAQLAKKAHQQSQQQPAQSQSQFVDPLASVPSSGLSSALPTNRRGSDGLSSNPASSRTPARSRAASAGRHRAVEP